MPIRVGFDSVMVTNKGLIALLSSMLIAGLVGTMAVLTHVLPMPHLAPPIQSASAFTNAFAAKDQLLVIYQWVRFYALRSVPPSVVLGRNGWLYYRSEAVSDGASINDFMGRALPDAATLSKWKRTLVERRQSLEEKGIKYLAFVAPNTMSIYPENLPMEIQSKRGRTRLDAVMDMMPDEILDLRAALLQRKRIEPVYNSSDTHWNIFGALTAYETVTARLAAWFPGIRPVQRIDLDLMTRDGIINREIEDMVGRWKWKPKPNIFVNARKVFGSRCADTGEYVLAPGPLRNNWVWSPSPCPSRRFIQDQKNLPKAIIFHDSFLEFMNVFLSQNFREVHYYRGRFDSAVIDREKPDVIVDELTERYLDHLF